MLTVHSEEKRRYISYKIGHGTRIWFYPAKGSVWFTDQNNKKVGCDDRERLDYKLSLSLYPHEPSVKYKFETLVAVFAAIANCTYREIKNPDPDDIYTIFELVGRPKRKRRKSGKR